MSSARLDIPRDLNTVAWRPNTLRHNRVKSTISMLLLLLYRAKESRMPLGTWTVQHIPCLKRSFPDRPTRSEEPLGLSSGARDTYQTMPVINLLLLHPLFLRGLFLLLFSSSVHRRHCQKFGVSLSSRFL